MYAEAFVRLSSAWLLIRLVPFSAWRGLMGQPGPLPQSNAARDQDKAIASEIASLHFVVHRVFGTRFTCLMLALSARGMLKVRGIPSELVLGVKRKADNSQTDKLGAHAWVRSGPIEIIGQEGSEDFTPVAVFGAY